MKYKINKDMIKNFYPKSRCFGCHNKKVNIAIDIVVDPIKKRILYELSQNHKVIYQGPELDDAIEIYNNILENA